MVSVARATLACLIATLVIPIALMTPPADATVEPVTSLRVATVDSTSITLAWSLERNPHQSKVVVRYAAGWTAPARPSDGTKGAVLDPRRSERVQIGGLKTAALYSFSVFVKNDDGTVSKRAVVRGRTGPPPVTDLTALPYRTRIELAWSVPDHPSVAKVVVRYAWGLPPRTLAGGIPVPLDSPLATSITLADLPERTDFGFTVWTRDAKGRLSSPQRISATTIHYPGTVTDLTATPIEDHSIELTWSNPTTPHFYGVLVRRCEGNTDDCQDLATLGPETTTFTDTDVVPDAPYQYGLYSIGAENEVTPWSEGVSVTAGPTIDDPATPNDHCGHVNASTTWTGVHTISCTVVIDPGVTLTIAPGSTIEMTSGYLRALGSVIATGTSEASITWSGEAPRIRIERGASLAASYDDFGDTTIVGDNAASIAIDHAASRGLVSAEADVVTISHSQLVNVGADGPEITLDGNRIDGYAVARHNDPGSLTVSNNAFTGVEPGIIDDSPMVISSTELRHLDFPGNTSSGYAYNAIRIYGILTTDATVSSPAEGSMPIAVHGLSVEPGVTLTIAPGTLLRAYSIGLQAGASLDVAGTPGTEADPDGQRVTIVGLDDRSVDQPGYFGPDYQVPESPILYSAIGAYDAASLRVRSLDLTGLLFVAARGTIDVEDLHASGLVNLTTVAGDPTDIRFVDSTVLRSPLPVALEYPMLPTVWVISAGGRVDVSGITVDHPSPAPAAGINVINLTSPTASTVVHDNVVRGTASPRPAESTDSCPVLSMDCVALTRGISVAVLAAVGQPTHVPLVTRNTVEDFSGVALVVRAPATGTARLLATDLSSNSGAGNWADSIAIDGVVEGDWQPVGTELTPASLHVARPPHEVVEDGLRFTPGATLTIDAGRTLRGFTTPDLCDVYICSYSNGEQATLAVDHLVANGAEDAPVTIAGLGGVTGAVDGSWVDFVDSRAVVTGTSTLDHASFSGSVHGAGALLEVRNTQDPETSEWSTVDLAITNSVFRPGPNTFAAVVDLNGQVDQQTGELQPRGSVSIAADFEIPTGAGLLRLPNGTATITGHLVSRASDSAPQIVTACAHADSRCSGSMAGFDWGSPDGPFQGPGLPLACGAVTVSPWAGQVDPEVDHAVPDCA